ncbi:MAG: nickel ABC transporter ATP-binding protein NikE [Rhizobiales bacterium]|nr:nickel ABC transporter ATP-binding protein NikE [Hyphomicrobiales bacterium]
MSEPLLEIRRLVVEALTRDADGGAHWRPILKGVDLAVAKGEVVGLIGESGAGKSTLGIAAMGYTRRGCRFAGGKVRFGGRDVLTAGDDVLRGLRGRKVAYVAQSAAAAFNPAHQLLDQVLEVTRIHGGLERKAATARALTLFERLGLPDPARFGERYPHEVSGGQLQRAMTAMALAGEPDLVVFDEPTTALDVTTQIDVLAIVKDVIRDLGTAAIYISHDLAVVVQIADRIKVMRHGAEVEEQPTAKLLEQPREGYTRELLSARRHSRPEARASVGPLLVEARGVTAGYGRLDVLHDVGFSLRSGANLAVVGESGSGKSTLARVLMGLLRPRVGTVLYKGEVVAARLGERPRDLKRRMQLIHQQPDMALNPRQTVEEIVGRPARLFHGLTAGALAQRVRELLAMVDLPVEIAHRYPGQLSGGQKQRVCIARAIAADPELIICDEVTSALDPLVAGEIIRLLMRLQERIGVSYIFITHDIDLARGIADDVLVMRHGRVVEHGPREVIFSPPFADYTHLLVTSTPEMRPGWLEDVQRERRMASAGH